MTQAVQTRGAAVIAARKLSSAMSAAKAIADHMHTWWFGTPEGEYTSMGVWTDGSKYGITSGIVYSLPVTIKVREHRARAHLALCLYVNAEFLSFVFLSFLCLSVHLLTCPPPLSLSPFWNTRHLPLGAFLFVTQDGVITVVDGLTISDFSRDKMLATEHELVGTARGGGVSGGGGGGGGVERC